MKIEITGIPSKPQAVVLGLMAIYVIAFCVFLCISAERIQDLSARRIYALLGLIPLVILYGLFLLAAYLFTNIKEVVSKFKKDNSFLEDYGYKYNSYIYDKKSKILRIRYVHKNYLPLFFPIWLRKFHKPYCMPLFYYNEEYISIWHFLNFLDKDFAGSIDKFQDCMEFMVNFMEKKPSKLRNEIKNFINSMKTEGENEQK